MNREEVSPCPNNNFQRQPTYTVHPLQKIQVHHKTQHICVTLVQLSKIRTSGNSGVS